MAVVKELHYPTGGVDYIHDDAYINKTPEELKKVEDDFRRIAAEIEFKKERRIRGEIWNT